MNDNWYKLDNVAKVFLAAHNKRDTRALRVSCSLNEEIDPAILQQALEQTVRLRPQFQVRIRRGLFWNYLEKTDAVPVVTEESDRPCPILYGNYYRGILHYKVTYYGKRINFDIFHAICDGTGAFAFLKLLVMNYLSLLHPELAAVSIEEKASSDDRFQNSYDHFYDKASGIIPKRILNKKNKAYLISGPKLLYDQLQFFEIHYEADKLIRKSKELGVSLTSYIGAALMLSISEGMPFIQRRKPITISLPVNLRQYFPSVTLRNFFNSVDVSHYFDGTETIEELAKEFDIELKSKLDKQLIINQMNRYQSIERLFFTRMVPLAIKQPVVRTFAKAESKTVTAVLSNLGPISMPKETEKYINCFTDFCSTDKLFITITTYGNDLVFGITSAYSGTGVLKRLVHRLKDVGGNVTLYSSEVIR